MGQGGEGAFGLETGGWGPLSFSFFRPVWGEEGGVLGVGVVWVWGERCDDFPRLAHPLQEPPCWGVVFVLGGERGRGGGGFESFASFLVHVYTERQTHRHTDRYWHTKRRIHVCVCMCTCAPWGRRKAGSASSASSTASHPAPCTQNSPVSVRFVIYTYIHIYMCVFARVCKRRSGI